MFVVCFTYKELSLFRLTDKEMKQFGIENVDAVGEDGDAKLANKPENEVSLMDDALGVHFLEIQPLYVAYVYVMTGK
jgi:hypothetical protein